MLEGWLEAGGEPLGQRGREVAGEIRDEVVWKAKITGFGSGKKEWEL